MDRTEYEKIAEENLDMVYRIALSHTGKEADAEYDPGQALSGGEYGQEDPVFAQQEKRELLEALGNLPPVLRSVLYLFYYEGYKTREIAQILHVREATVRTRLARGRKLLREELKEA